MSARTAHVAAVDLGAGSGRVMVAEVGADQLRMRQVARFDNEPARLWDGRREVLHWDLPGIFGQVCHGLADLAREVPDLASIGVDSWAVDYGLLTDGRLTGLPRHHRDARGDRGIDAVLAHRDRRSQYEANGLQFLPFNTVYQLADDAACGLLGGADRLLLVPDLMAYWLSGRQVAEVTNASTTGLLTLDRQWDAPLLDELGIDVALLPDLVEPGTTLGPVLAPVRERTRLPEETTVTAVASHDTACAVAATPLDEHGAFVSCGTWALVGVELPAPVVTPEAMSDGFTNERGLDGRIRFLHNVMGLWLLDESLRWWQRSDPDASLSGLLDAAAGAAPTTVCFDTDDQRFLAPGDIPGRIAAWYREHGLPAPSTPVETTRAIVDSLAAAFARVAFLAGALTGHDVQVIHVVGGGAQSTLLCQLTADHAEVPVLAGPVEATALGNALVQGRSLGVLPDDPDELRRLVAQHHRPRVHRPVGHR